MLSTLKSHLLRAINPDRRRQNRMFAYCIFFGLAMVANTQPAADGGWFWYGILLRDGRHLYSDLHLALQPLFVLETAWFQAWTGPGWLASKIPAVLHVVTYCSGLLLLVRYSTLPDRKKALVLGSVFFFSICFEAYRFDDYHVLADCFEIYSILLLLKIQRSLTPRQTLLMAAGLGILSGLALETRLNDGAALFAAVLLAIYCLAPAKKFLAIATFGLASTLTVVLVVRLTGDSFHDYAMYSIFKAAASKGGTTNVLAYPLQLPFSALQTLELWWYDEIIASTFAVAFLLIFLVRPLWWSRRSPKINRPALVKGMLGLFLILLPIRLLFHAILLGEFIVAAGAVGVLAAYLLGILVIARFLRSQLMPRRYPQWNSRELLFLIPLGQLVSAAMSSGGQYRGLYAPLAIMILLLPIVSPLQLREPLDDRKKNIRSLLLAMAALLMCLSVMRKILVPYSWHTYRALPMFVGRQWFHHPVYGPMIIESAQLAFIEQVCTHIRADGPSPELLSLPYPYANYFCATPPWHGYVQTFFDTSSKETIDTLIAELQTAPPKWILYQRQLDNLAMHERIYHKGQPLPHRQLDQVIEQKIASGEWQIAYTSDYGNKPNFSNQWILFRTHPPAQLTPSSVPGEKASLR